jgi:hypothetical protein
VKRFPVEHLHWPKDKWRLAFLSLADLQAWYAFQNYREMIHLGYDSKFVSFWYWAYLFPLKIRRNSLKIKRFLWDAFSITPERVWRGF